MAYSCADEKTLEPAVRKVNHRSVMVYMVAENTLYPFVYGSSHSKGDVMEMLEGCKDIPDSCELLVYVDDLSKPRIYVIDNKTAVRSVYDLQPEIQYDDDGNSASPEVLSNALTYMYTKHEARSYGLVLWSHGSGWVDGGEYTPDEHRQNARKNSFGVDNQMDDPSIKVGFEMNISDLAGALERFDNMEFVLFDACFMQTIETLYALRHSADYIIGSPAEIPGLGAPYDKLMASLFAEPFSPDSLARKYYEYYMYEDKDYQGALLSAIETRHLEDFALATRQAIGDVDLRGVKLIDVLNYFVYDSWRSRTLSGIPDCYDMKGIIQKNIPSDRYEQWLKALERITAAKYATPTWYSCYYYQRMKVDSTQYSGISMYVPLQKYIDKSESFTSEYYKTDWYKALNE